MVPDVVKLWNGVKLPTVGFGTWQLKGTDCYDSVATALKIGYKLIDTASRYGNEEEVGEAVRAYEAANDTRIFVTSKANINEMGFNETYEACINSLKRLKMESLGLYLLHWPGSESLPNDSSLNRAKRRESWQAMEKLYNEGKARSIGVSNYLVYHLDQLIQDGVQIKPMVDQIEYHPMCQNEDLMNWASANKMQLQAYSSLGVGNSELLKHPTVLEIEKETGRTAAQVLLRWGLQKNLCILPRSKTSSRIDENFRVCDFELTDEQMNKLSSINVGKHFCWDPNKVI